MTDSTTEQQELVELLPCPLMHNVFAGLRVNKKDPKILCLDCGLSIAATDWTTLYERWQSRPPSLARAAAGVEEAQSKLIRIAAAILQRVGEIRDLRHELRSDPYWSVGQQREVIRAFDNLLAQIKHLQQWQDGLIATTIAWSRQGMAQPSLADGIAKIREMRDEWQALAQNYQIGDPSWIAHKAHAYAANEIITALESLTPAPETPRSMDSAPRDGTPIQVYFKGRINQWVTVSWTDNENSRGWPIWCVDDFKHGPYPLRGYIETDAIGWLPLPPTPETQGDNNVG